MITFKNLFEHAGRKLCANGDMTLQASYIYIVLMMVTSGKVKFHPLVIIIDTRSVILRFLGRNFYSGINSKWEKAIPELHLSRLSYAILGRTKEGILST